MYFQQRFPPGMPGVLPLRRQTRWVSGSFLKQQFFIVSQDNKPCHPGKPGGRTWPPGAPQPPRTLPLHPTGNLAASPLLLCRREFPQHGGTRVLEHLPVIGHPADFLRFGQEHGALDLDPGIHRDTSVTPCQGHKCPLIFVKRLISFITCSSPSCI